MIRPAMPVILAALLATGGAVLVLAGADNATSKGNQAPIDDNHRGSPAPVGHDGGHR